MRQNIASSGIFPVASNLSWHSTLRYTWRGPGLFSSRQASHSVPYLQVGTGVAVCAFATRFHWSWVFSCSTVEIGMLMFISAARVPLSSVRFHTSCMVFTTMGCSHVTGRFSRMASCDVNSRRVFETEGGDVLILVTWVLSGRRLADNGHFPLVSLGALFCA